MSRRKAPRTPTPKYRYSIRQLNAVEYATEIMVMLAPIFSPESNAPTAFIGVSWWGAFATDANGELLVGVGGMCHSAIEEDTFYLNRSAVLKDHRGHGLQRKLIQARVQRAKEMKGLAVTSDTYDNPHSANNLISCGFRAYQPAQPWRAEGSMYWRLKL